jgi:hypothetical protein
MAFRGLRSSDAGERALMELLRDRGSEILVMEVVALAGFSVAAMTTDRFWSRRGRCKRADDSQHPADVELPP